MSAVTVRVYNATKLQIKLMDNIDTHIAISDTVGFYRIKSKLHSLLAKFGSFVGKDFVIVDNEFADDWNPFHLLDDALRAVFGAALSEMHKECKFDWFEILLELNHEYICTSVDLHDAIAEFELQETVRGIVREDEASFGRSEGQINET